MSRSFYTYPRSSDYNNAWRQLVERMRAIRAGVEARLQEQQRYSNLLIADRQVIEDAVRQGFAQLDLEDAKRGGYREVSVEGFTTPIEGLTVDAVGSYATLPVTSREEIRLGVPEILWNQSSPDGIPGNWGETQTVGKDQDLKDRAVVVFGNDKTEALVDATATTHFEYERCVVDPIQKTTVYDIRNGNATGETEKHVLEIIAPDPWEISIPERGDRLMVAAVNSAGEQRGKLSSVWREIPFLPPLRVKVRIPVADTDRAASQLVISPYLTSNQLSKAPFRLVSVTAVGNQGGLLLTKNFTMDRTRSLRLPDTTLKELELTFVQEKSYRCMIGHHYYEEKLLYKQSGRALFGLINLGKADRYEWKRVADQSAPLGVVSTKQGNVLQNAGLVIGDLGSSAGGIMSAIPGGQALGGIVTAASDAFTTVWKGMFGSTTKTTERVAVRDGWDIFTGERYGIGISDVQLQEVVYAKESSAVLGPFIFSQPARFISIHATYQLPDEFPDGNWLSFEYSSDQNIWTTIAMDEVVAYTGVQVWVRVTMKRPEELDHSSPLLHEVRVYAS